MVFIGNEIPFLLNCFLSYLQICAMVGLALTKPEGVGAPAEKDRSEIFHKEDVIPHPNHKGNCMLYKSLSRIKVHFEATF